MVAAISGACSRRNVDGLFCYAPIVAKSRKTYKRNTSFFARNTQNHSMKVSFFKTKSTNGAPMTTENVVLEDGIVIPVQTRIKNICKKRREELRVTNQQIADGIYEMFNVDIPVSTISSFFADRSKAGSVYTTGYICAYLGVSLDEQFGIQCDSLNLTEREIMQERIVSKDTEIRMQRELIDELKNGIRNRRPVIWACLAAVVLMAAILLWYVTIDLSNPNAGFFQPDAGYPTIGIVTLGVVVLAVVAAVAMFAYTEFKKRKDLKK